MVGSLLGLLQALLCTVLHTAQRLQVLGLGSLQPLLCLQHTCVIEPLAQTSR